MMKPKVIKFLGCTGHESLYSLFTWLGDRPLLGYRTVGIPRECWELVLPVDLHRGLVQESGIGVELERLDQRAKKYIRLVLYRSFVDTRRSFQENGFRHTFDRLVGNFRAAIAIDAGNPSLFYDAAEELILLAAPQWSPESADDPVISLAVETVAAKHQDRLQGGDAG